MIFSPLTTMGIAGGQETVGIAQTRPTACSVGTCSCGANPACRMRYYRKAGVDPAAAPFVLRTIRSKYGSAENYLEAEYGLTPARLMRLRRMYLE